MRQAFRISSDTVTRGFTYLYRWWIQAELQIVPEAYIRQSGVSTIICPLWGLVGSERFLEREELDDLAADLHRPVYGVCPSLVSGIRGLDLTNGIAADVPDDILTTFSILEARQEFLRMLGPENTSLDEWWKTTECGTFEVWCSQATRLLLYPTRTPAHAYVVRASHSEGEFLMPIRQWRQDGELRGRGAYKMSEHRLSNGRRVSCLDLLFDNGTVLLYRMQPAGAGYRMFKRRTPGYEGRLL